MIKVNDLSYKYSTNSKLTLKGISFKIDKGEIFGFLGPSGAGKSTTQKILFGLLKNYLGSVSLMGKEISEWDSTIYEKIGVSFELPNHYMNLTAKENLDYFSSLYSVECNNTLDVLSWVGLMEDGDKKIKNFSKGMKIRLNVARSILHKPKILFLDEPTSGLDPVNARMIKDLILRLRDEGATIFVTTHNMSVADELCNQVAFITDGEVRLIDSPEALKKSYGKRNITVSFKKGKEIMKKEFPIEGLGINKVFIDLLNSGNEIESIHSQETTLEDIFIRVTGEELV